MEPLPAGSAEENGATEKIGRAENYERPRLKPGGENACLRVVIVGTGFIADYHMEVLQEIPSVEVVAACDLSETRLHDFGQRWKIPQLCASVDELLSKSRPDVAHVLVPPAHHYRVAKQLMEAGVNVLLEKPMALCAQEANELAALANRHSVCLGINHNWLYHPLFQRALNDIAQRKIGPVRHVVSTNSLPLFQLSAGQHDHWMFDRPTNILFEQGVHPLSQVCRLIGEVSSVETTRNAPRTLRGGKEFFANWQFAMKGENATAQMSLAFGSIFPDVQLRIIGQDGAIQLDQLNDLYTIDRRSRLIDAGDRFVRGCRQARGIAMDACRGLIGYGLSLLKITGRRDSYYLGMKGSIANYYQCVRRQELRAATAENGRHTIGAIDKVLARWEDRSAAAPAKPRVVQCEEVQQATQIGRVAVFGASGFIGRKVVEKLATAGVPQRLFVRSKKRVADIETGPRIEVVAGDVRNADEVRNAIAGCNAVIHLVAGAPTSWPEFERLFVSGLKNAADAAIEHGVKHFLFASSITSLYLGNRNEVITENTPVDRKWRKRCDYARAKVICENLLLDLHQHSGLPAVIMRPGIVIGEGSAVQHLGLGEWPSETLCMRWGRDIDNELPLVLAKDVAEAFYCALKTDPEAIAGKAFNLVGDVRLSAREYVEILRNSSERDFRLRRQSVACWAGVELFKWTVKAAARKSENSRLTWRELKYRTGVAKFDCRLTKSLLGWVPEANRDAFVECGLRAPLQGIA